MKFTMQKEGEHDIICTSIRGLLRLIDEGFSPKEDPVILQKSGDYIDAFLPLAAANTGRILVCTREGHSEASWDYYHKCKPVLKGTDDFLEGESMLIRAGYNPIYYQQHLSWMGRAQKALMERNAS